MGTYLFVSIDVTQSTHINTWVHISLYLGYKKSKFDSFSSRRVHMNFGKGQTEVCKGYTGFHTEGGALFAPEGV